MRLAGQQRGGYYPAAPEAVIAAARHLGCTRKPFHILDPCAGEGMALHQLAGLTGGTPWAIELDEGRAEACRDLIPNCLAPASAFGCKVGNGYFDLIWLNPPYDDEIGGGQRVEHKFLMHCTPWLKPGGVMCLVVPEHQVRQYSPCAEYLYDRFDEVTLMYFPEDVRKHREVVVFGYRRDRSRDREKYTYAPHIDFTPEDMVYHVPGGVGPKVWEKVQLTEDEVGRALAASRLQKLLEPTRPLPLPRPPLPLAKGHIAMLLASGHLDGVVRPEGEAPHVVRGTAQKKMYLAEQTENENEKGEVTTKTVYREKIVLTVRAVDKDGNLRTFAQE